MLVSHVSMKALVEIDEICMAGGESLLFSRKNNFCELKMDSFRNLTPFILLWKNKISFIIIDVVLIGRQTMINCFVFER